MVSQEQLSTFEETFAFNRLIVGGTITPIVLPGGGFSFCDEVDGRRTFTTVGPDGATSPTFDDAALGKALATHLGGSEVSRAGEGLPFKTFFSTGPNTIGMETGGRLLQVDVSTNAVSDLDIQVAQRLGRSRPLPQGDARWAGDEPPRELAAPDGRSALGLDGHDLAVRHFIDDRRQRLTTDGVDDVTWQVALGAWSPDAAHVAVPRIDARHTNRLPVVHWLQDVEQVEWRPYTKAGASLPHNELHLFDVRAGTSVRVQVTDDPEDQYFPVAWLPDGSALLVATLTRTFCPLTLWLVDARTGQGNMLVNEDPGTFVYGIRNILWFRDCARLLPAGNEFLWFSERDGHRHLYRYDLEGTCIGQVTSGSFELEDIVAVTPETVVVTAHSDPKRPYDIHICSARLDGQGEVTVLTQEPGVHQAFAVPGGTHLVDRHSSLTRPAQVDLRDETGKVTTTLAQANTSRLDQIDYQTGTEFTALAADGETELWGVMFMPPEFDPSRTYPVIEYIYGGPQNTQLPREFDGAGRGNFPRALATLGFVTFVMDGRGTPERGKAFQDVVHGRFGEFHVEDHAAVLRQLTDRHSFMDAGRVGVIGGSWGGYNTLRSLVLAPEQYQVGVCIYGPGDLYDHWAGPIEGYMGLPQDNREAYRRASSLEIIDQLVGKLLVIHGTSDVNATFSGAMKIADACVNADKPLDMIVIPGQAHSVTGVGGRYMIRSAARYFVEHLRP